MRTPLLIALALALLPGCATLPTFQTADVLEPGKMKGGFGITGGDSGNALDAPDPDDGTVPFTQPDVYVRVGALPRTEVAIRSAGPSAWGGNVKVAIAREPGMLTANAGFGRSSVGLCLYGCVDTQVRTYHAALIGGTRQVEFVDQIYGGVRLTKYAYLEERGDRTLPENRTEFERLMPGGTLGLVGHSKGRAAPVLEVNVYAMPHFAYTISGGLVIELR